VSAPAGRSWGYWTEAKLAILHDYLPAFLNASKGKASEFVYLDAFAGEGHGISRLTGQQFSGSARIALDVAVADGFTKLRYFEKEEKAHELEQRLLSEYPGRDIKVYGGDCNQTIATALKELQPVRWAPTFAFVDPDVMELAWQTLRRLADHKRGYRPSGSSRPEYKVELWLLFPTQGLIRTLALDERKLRSADEDRATQLYGTDSWRAIYDRRVAGKLSPSEAREEYVNLMRWRLTNDLGYANTHPFELKNTRGGTVYHMVFATDSEAGDRIMTQSLREDRPARARHATAGQRQGEGSSHPSISAMSRSTRPATNTNRRGSRPRQAAWVRSGAKLTTLIPDRSSHRRTWDLDTPRVRRTGATSHSSRGFGGGLRRRSSTSGSSVSNGERSARATPSKITCRPSIGGLVRCSRAVELECDACADESGQGAPAAGQRHQQNRWRRQQGQRRGTRRLVGDQKPRAEHGPAQGHADGAARRARLFAPGCASAQSHNHLRDPVGRLADAEQKAADRPGQQGGDECELDLDSRGRLRKSSLSTVSVLLRVAASLPAPRGYPGLGSK
jgi:three-Cys-motif partner protein